MDPAFEDYDPSGWGYLVPTWLPLAVAIVVFVWGLRQQTPARRKLAHLWMKRTLWLCTPWPIAQTMRGIFRVSAAFGGTLIDPAQKARILAEVISEAMNCIAWMFFLLLMVLPMVIVLRRRIPRQEVTPTSDDGEPPPLT